MDFTSKNTSLLILAITAVVLSRVTFALFDDPEGPNLLIVLVLAAILYGLSLAVYTFGSAAKGGQKILLAILVQVLVAVVLYFWGR